MSPDYTKLEAETREEIDEKLEAAGWVIQDYKQINLVAGEYGIQTHGTKSIIYTQGINYRPEPENFPSFRVFFSLLYKYIKEKEKALTRGMMKQSFIFNSGEVRARLKGQFSFYTWSNRFDPFQALE